MWNFAVISQNRGKIPPESWITSVCLIDKAILKRFSHTQVFFIFSKINDGSSTDFSKFLENWTLIKKMVIFEAACEGDVRNRISMEISSLELTIMKTYDFNHYW